MRLFAYIVKIGLLAALALSCLGCATTQSSTPFAHLSWPVEAPQVWLERVIRTSDDVGGRSFINRLFGAPPKELFVRPIDVAWDGDALLVADPGAGRLVRIDPSGRLSETAFGVVTSPVGVAVCPFGIAVTDSQTGQLLLLDRQLQNPRVVLEYLERPTGVACDASGIYVSETAGHRIIVVSDPGTPASMTVKRFGSRGSGAGELNYPVPLWLDGSDLWVGDTLNFRLQVFDPRDGESKGSFGKVGDSPGENPRIKGVAVDARGRLWVSDAYLDQVSVYTREGQFLVSIGLRGESPGMFSFPAGIAASSGRLVAVADSLNRRIQIFRIEADADR
jgi:DNA-binding beta-propeller fold protein YncE